MADDIGYFGMIAAIATFVCMTLHLFYEAYLGEIKLFSLKALAEFVQFFMIAVSVLVMAIPEGNFTHFIQLIRTAFGCDSDFGFLLFQDVPGIEFSPLVISL
jgi:hypothetical protein